VDATSFKNALSEAKPPIEALLNVGLGLDEALALISAFEISQRRQKEHFALPDATLADLYEVNDVSRVEIGMVRLRQDPEKMANGWILGEVEADRLLLDKRSGEILVTDHASLDHVLWRCAENGSSFLDALALAAKYLSICSYEDQFGTALQNDTLRSCTALAGGDAYLSFYEMLLGCE